jgi:hypothetical protein
LLIDLAICADWAEKAGSERRIDSFEQLQEDQADPYFMRLQEPGTGRYP